MRALVGIRFCEERAENTYGHSALSRELIDPNFRTVFVGMYVPRKQFTTVAVMSLIASRTSTAGLTMAKLPECLATINFHSPADSDNALFQYALGTNLNMFQWLETQPEHLVTFSAYNAALTKTRGPVLRATLCGLLSAKEPATPSERAPIEENVVLLVDVGASRGQVLGDIRKERPDLVGRMIAQDLPGVLADREIADGVEKMAFDFFQPQPVKGEQPPFLPFHKSHTPCLPLHRWSHVQHLSQKSLQINARTPGASIYFFSHIFHDWPDVTCRQILTNTLPALTANYSRIVIVDQVLPNIGAAAISSLMDLSMMTFGGMERTERQWRELLVGVGLSVVSIEEPKMGILGMEGTIVAMLKQ